MKKLWIYLGLFLYSIQLSLMAVNDVLDIGGAMTVGATGYYVPSDQQYKQLDTAFNIDFNLSISEEIDGFFQFQGASGSSYLGFPGPEAVLTDINITYQAKGKPYDVIMGSFDTPFGQYTGRLTNNADSSANSFVKNPLLYTTLAGYVGTLNTLGVMSNIQHSLFDASIAITNGTAESALNDDGNFETVFRIKPTYLLLSDTSFSYIYSDDRGNSDSFDTVFSGWMLDLDKALTDNLDLKLFYAELNYDDSDAATEDIVTSYLIELAYKLDMYSLAFRYESYQRQDQSDVNADIPNVFLSTSALADGSVFQRVDVFSVGYTRYLSDQLLLKTEGFVEIGDDNQKATGAVSYITVLF